MTQSKPKKDAVPGERYGRVVIEAVKPQIDGGLFPIKRCIGERVVVEADIFADGHDALSAVLLWKHVSQDRWSEVPFTPLVNDRWRAEFLVTQLGRYVYTIEAWVDVYSSWSQNLRKKSDAGQDVAVDLEIGADIVARVAERSAGKDADELNALVRHLTAKSLDQAAKVRLALESATAPLVGGHPDRELATRFPRELEVVVDPKRALFGAWYEMFPRSCAEEPGAHGTFRDCEKRLPYVAEMGFDVLYLPPIHPVGRTNRKGQNNSPTCRTGDPGSPWAIGAEEGGHKSVHPRLGTIEDFRRLVAKARDNGLEVALDIAFQCCPDHPYVKDHPEWFRRRPDGSVQYAENPPKKYEDIYPLNFDTSDWQALWDELLSVVEFWIGEGIRLFRVDNPHTKPFAFWEWLIREVKSKWPDVILLSEAFTRPKVMYRLAKLGFTQSYTYFAWRNARWELEQYFTELTQTDVREYFRPNLWPNTPDILTEYLQAGGRPAFMTRLVLAATLGASYGIYGPAFELCERVPRERGSEEYLDSEKYAIRQWNLEHEDSLREFIARVNRIRRNNPALQSNDNLQFHLVDNDQLICYSKRTIGLENIILVVVNLDPHHRHSGWVHIPLEQFGLEPSQAYQVHDLLSDSRYLWNGPRNYVDLNPHVVPAHIFRLRRRVRSEQDFEYFV